MFRWKPSTGDLLFVAGDPPDILEALLRGWLPPVQAFLFTRGILKRSGGWNEHLTSAQDFDLHIRIALNGANYQYLTGCQSAFRRPHVVTASTRDPQGLHRNIIKILSSAESRLIESGRLNEQYKKAIAHYYLSLACGNYNYFDRDRDSFTKLLQEAHRLSPSYIYPYSRLYYAVSRTFECELLNTSVQLDVVC